MTWLYTYENESNGGRFYAGIGENVARVWQPHNPEAEALRDDPRTVILRTATRFSTRKDALMAEAIAIHVASFFGARVILDASDGEQILRESDSLQRIVTNISGTVQTKHLVPALPIQEGAPPVRYSHLIGAAIVMTTLEELDERPAVSGASTFDALAERASQFWRLRRRVDAATSTSTWPIRLILVSKGHHVILGDWDLADGAQSMRALGAGESQPNGSGWCAFRLARPRWTIEDGTAIGDVGRTLEFDTAYGPKNLQGSVAGWSEDLRITWGMAP
ncbi:hypothetical protein [Oerskovia merdavium]|uniref:GIY-YIG nuclease family protein n=1 Tax=Oerskovia merdavium TaxID=2762227 RepID=A0ABR8TWV2_9CELL|nr:hypothetical protein [Oerskovia merdavium]MBD7980217.1 hypothetical protein [Oerskovia merdavium]